MATTVAIAGYAGARPRPRSVSTSLGAMAARERDRRTPAEMAFFDDSVRVTSPYSIPHDPPRSKVLERRAAAPNGGWSTSSSHADPGGNANGKPAPTPKNRKQATGREEQTHSSLALQSTLCSGAATLTAASGNISAVVPYGPDGGPYASNMRCVWQICPDASTTGWVSPRARTCEPSDRGACAVAECPSAFSPLTPRKAPTLSSCGRPTRRWAGGRRS